LQVIENTQFVAGDDEVSTHKEIVSILQLALAVVGHACLINLSPVAELVAESKVLNRMRVSA